jgi:hypothetical protein
LNLQVVPIFDLKINCSSRAHLLVAQTNFHCCGPVTLTRAACHGPGHQAVTALAVLSAAEPAAVGGR